jgi:hypothetical protein
VGVATYSSESLGTSVPLDRSDDGPPARAAAKFPFSVGGGARIRLTVARL